MSARKLGFTIIELLVIISVISILITLVTVNLTGAKYKSNYTETLSDMDTMADAAKLYRSEHGSWPLDDGDLPAAAGGGIRDYSQTGLQLYLPTPPTPPCNNYFYTWDNWTNVSDTYKDPNDILRVTYRSTLGSQDFQNARFFSCISSVDGTCLNVFEKTMPTNFKDIKSINAITCKE